MRADGPVSCPGVTRQGQRENPACRTPAQNRRPRPRDCGNAVLPRRARYAARLPSRLVAGSEHEAAPAHMVKDRGVVRSQECPELAADGRVDGPGHLGGQLLGRPGCTE